MDLFGVDWSDGWAGNFTAELVGVVLGLIVTYLVADRVVRWRLRQERRTVTDRLFRSLRSTIYMITFWWAVILDIRGVRFVSDNPELQRRVRKQLEPIALTLKRAYELAEQHQAEDIPIVEAYLTPEYWDLAHRLSASSISHLAKGILDSKRHIGPVADRYATVFEEDAVLNSLVGDLEECARFLDQELASGPREYELDTGEVVEDADDLFASCVWAFHRASRLQSHLDRAS